MCVTQVISVLNDYTAFTALMGRQKGGGSAVEQGVCVLADQAKVREARGGGRNENVLFVEILVTPPVAHNKSYSQREKHITCGRCATAMGLSNHCCFRPTEMIGRPACQCTHCA